ncbi:hypothetical protein HL667_24185 [Bradyrhizobium sp. 83012]|uniref:Uncharacterized protein n=1 Tax=Bradyrhizobium aeschynomenes TaxID=2734909 RepID=A0ABX2CIV5_9BRAD|nr:hypothetical protein [Bradyrhizobium aeschynomenes]NPU11034.1 hypothetical protein [Bradyrhizobium aeschynomenes]NPU68123.1 hypothetical protein [Bradyrhizobium aeschynomenes]NPV21689.1 hypothetical protein [Bradyrhizobium aeschynomenes]
MRGVRAEAAAQPPRRTWLPTLVLILLGIMIVRDIVVRRWNGAPPAGSDVTRLR